MCVVSPEFDVYNLGGDTVHECMDHGDTPCEHPTLVPISKKQSNKESRVSFLAIKRDTHSKERT